MTAKGVQTTRGRLMVLVGRTFAWTSAAIVSSSV